MYLCVSVSCDLLFFFKQKTAYEMRISDWSSDVCSSDLPSPVSGDGSGWTAPIVIRNCILIAYNSRSRLDGRRTPGIHMARYQPLSASAQTAYAQLLDDVHGAELTRSVANLAGTFARKQVKGKTYWYFQYTEVSGKIGRAHV